MGSARAWRVGLATLVVPALALAALAAGSYRPFAGGAESSRSASATFVDAVFTVAAVVLVALVLTLVWVRWQAPKRPGRSADRQFSLLGLLLFLAVMTTAVVVFRHGLQQPPPAPVGEEDLDPAFPTLTEPRPPVPESEQARAVRFVWPLAGGVAALIAAAVVTAVIVRPRRSREDVGAGPEQLERLRAALDEAIEDLRAEPDPRRAVVAAYARMEQALSVVGLSRDAAEAPYEYLRRVGRELDAEPSVAELTELFELAKFSDHGVGEPMRQRAIRALVDVRDEVRRAA